MNELKECPFCGGTAALHKCDGAGVYHADVFDAKKLWGRDMTHYLVICQKCGVRTKAYDTLKGVAKAWNRREQGTEEIHPEANATVTFEGGSSYRCFVETYCIRNFRKIEKIRDIRKIRLFEACPLIEEFEDDFFDVRVTMDRDGVSEIIKCYLSDDNMTLIEV